jgi:hypothetical protein
MFLRTSWSLCRCVGHSTARGLGSQGELFIFRAADLAELNAQNWFHDHDPGVLHLKFGFDSEVSSSSTLIDDQEPTRAARLVLPWLSSYEIFVTFPFKVLLLYDQFAVDPDNLSWTAFLFVQDKCTFNMVSGLAILTDIRPTVYMNSLLFMWGVRMWVGVRYVAESTFRLNSRDGVREKSTSDHPESAYNLSSIRLEQSKSGQHGVAVNVHRTTTSDFVRTRSDDTKESPLENAKSVWNSCLFESSGPTAIF